MNSKGSASIEMVLFMTMLIVFLMLPLMSFGIEKIIIYTCIERIIDTMEIALYDCVESVSLEDLSVGEVYFEREQLEEIFYEKLDKRISNMVVINLTYLEFYPFEEGPLACSPQTEMTHDTLHVALEVNYEFSLYRELINIGKGNEVKFHFDLEIPLNN